MSMWMDFLVFVVLIWAGGAIFIAKEAPLYFFGLPFVLIGFVAKWIRHMMSLGAMLYDDFIE